MQTRRRIHPETAKDKPATRIQRLRQQHYCKLALQSGFHTGCSLTPDCANVANRKPNNFQGMKTK